MPNLNDFIGPKPKVEQINKLESLGAGKPCSKCKLDSVDSFWDPVNLIMSWTCPEGHSNSYRIN
jgi:hypothetical protein